MGVDLMPNVTVLGKQIYYEEYGQGEPVVFLNGIILSIQVIYSTSKTHKKPLIWLLPQSISNERLIS
jgi:hypothetical protein